MVWLPTASVINAISNHSQSGNIVNANAKKAITNKKVHAKK